MKNKFALKTYIGAALIAAVISHAPSAAYAQGNAFTYQGRLDDAGSPATGIYDLKFSMFDLGGGGTQQGGTLTNLATAVSNGLFTVTLDFGDQFPGAARWLEIGVATNGGVFSTLSPRQPLTPTPYAIHSASATSALSAATATSANSVAASNIIGTVGVGQISANVALRGGGNAFTSNQTITNGNLGVGTSTPVDRLSVMGGALSFANLADPVPYVGLDYDTGSDALRLRANVGSGALNQTRVTMTRNGNVGIGITNPAAPLHAFNASIPTAIIDGSSTVGTWTALRNTSVGGTNWHLISTGSANGEGPGKLLVTYGASPASVSGKAMTLQPNGNVGIGTTSPGENLSVATSTADTNASAKLSIHGFGGNKWVMQSVSGYDSPTISGGTLAGSLQFINKDTPVTAMTLAPFGNVGIGTNNPASKLTVNGIVESLSGGVKFPNGSVQDKAATRIIASVDMQFSQDDRVTNVWTHVENLGDDTTFPNIPLGFAYTGFGINTTNVSLSSNGILFFGQNASAALGNSPLPSSISPDAMLFFFWDDLNDYGPGEYFEYATFGLPGGRVFNLYFHNRLFSSGCGSDAINVMISIHESSNLIKVSYSGMSGCVDIRGGSATLGFQTPGGASATAFTVGVNSPVLDDNANRQTMSFHPPN